MDTGEFSVSVGRLAGLRAEVVHGGLESPELLRDGYYELEVMARLLLRHRLRLGPGGWPLNPSAPNLKAPLRQLAVAAQHLFRKTDWRQRE